MYLHEIGERLSPSHPLTKERVRQLERMALAKLKEAMTA
jgi:DNA-directed RNA polymerase sigma subunit (sigma70/sigma32)